jgi:hypothetical protein
VPRRWFPIAVIFDQATTVASRGTFQCVDDAAAA